MQTMSAPRILLIVGGGIAAYKACELVRLIRKGEGEVTCVLTEGGSKFVTPMALAALSENPVYTTLWDLKNEVEMGHIQLSRNADLLVVCPATADLLAKMATGIGDDLATTTLLATDKPVMAVPAMNVRMWQHEATQRNIAVLREAGVHVMDPDEGPMACGEYGPGRLPEPLAIWHRIAWALDIDPGDAALPSQEYVPQSLPDSAVKESEDTGLGGLLASMISRARKTFESAEEAPAWDKAANDPEELPVTEDTSVDMAQADRDSPLLSTKGKARAAPPTDPEAINHLVSRHEDAAPPEPFEGEGAESPEGALTQPEEPPIFVKPEDGPLSGKHVLITAGPTHEPIDPVRFIANRSSGKQGFAIAAAAAAAGARVTLVSGPVNLATPPGVDRIDVESAREMADAVKKALPADVGVMVAAVADWRVERAAHEKIKKRGSAPPVLMLTENPDILATVAGSTKRPKLLVGFAAETHDVLAHAKEKRKRKGADWIVANDVSGDVMGGEANRVHIVTAKGVEDLPEMPKDDVALALVERIADALSR